MARNEILYLLASFKTKGREKVSQFRIAKFTCTILIFLVKTFSLCKTSMCGLLSRLLSREEVIVKIVTALKLDTGFW